MQRSNYLNYTTTYNPLAVIDVEFTYAALNAFDTYWKDTATETIACASPSVSQTVVTLYMLLLWHHCEVNVLGRDAHAVLGSGGQLKTCTQTVTQLS